jgi:hypothetical protein
MLIDRIDSKRRNEGCIEESPIICGIGSIHVEPAEGEETFYERCLRVLGEHDCDWYWTYRCEQEQIRQRDRPPRTAADHSRIKYLTEKLKKAHKMMDFSELRQRA